jgi:hypothetical protein
LSLLAAGLLLVSANSLAGVRVVNCDKGDSLEKALFSGLGSAAPLEIQLLGTCNETFSFSRNNVTITGDGNTTIVGHIRMFSSHQVIFSSLNVTGPGPGVTVINGRVRFMGVNLVENEDVGVYGRQGAAINFADSHINGNHGGAGVLLENSYLTLNNSEVIGNWGDGISGSQNSTVTLRNTTVHAKQGNGVSLRMSSVIDTAGAHIWENQGVGIFMRTGSAGELHDSAVNANASQGIEVTGQSTLDIFGGMVGWNGDHGVWVSEHAFLRLIDAQVSSNIGHGLVIGRDGGAVLEGESGVEENTEFFQIVCQGKEASVDIVPPAHAGPMDCTDPEF